MKFFANCSLTLINSIIMIGMYSNNIELKKQTFEQFNELLNKSSK